MTEIVVHPTFVSNVLEAKGEIVGPRGSSGLNDAQRIALKNLLQIAAYAEDPTDEFAAFKSAFGFDAIVHVTGVSLNESSGVLDVNETVSLVATITPSNATNQAVTWTSSDDSVASVASDGTVTALGGGSATITVTTEDGGFTAAYVLTVASLSSISAVFTQGAATIYDTDTLDTLRQYLVVTATYTDSSTATVTDYTLSGTLTEGTSTITVSYGGKTDTFDVVVSSFSIEWDYTLGLPEDYGFTKVTNGTVSQTMTENGLNIYAVKAGSYTFYQVPLENDCYLEATIKPKEMNNSFFIFLSASSTNYIAIRCQYSQNYGGIYLFNGSDGSIGTMSRLSTISLNNNYKIKLVRSGNIGAVYVNDVIVAQNISTENQVSAYGTSGIKFQLAGTAGTNLLFLSASAGAWSGE